MQRYSKIDLSRIAGRRPVILEARLELPVTRERPYIRHSTDEVYERYIEYSQDERREVKCAFVTAQAILGIHPHVNVASFPAPLSGTELHLSPMMGG